MFSDIECNSNRAHYLKINHRNLIIKDNNLLYWSFPGYTIFNLNLNTLEMEPYTILHLGKNSISNDFIDKPWKNLRDFSSSFLKRELYFMNSLYSLKKDIYLFSSIKIYLGIDNKFSDELICYNKMSLFNIKNAPALSFRKDRIVVVGSADNDKIIFTWEAMNFINYCKNIESLLSSEDWKKLLVTYPGLERTLKETTKESNPILMIATLK